MTTFSLRHIIQFLRIKPYPEPTENGYWGKPTATIDWCEENYVCSPYVAEWSNTITNSLFVILAIYLTIICIRNRLDTRFILIALGFGLVGLGSWFFHMTLRYGYQLLDELPMVYVTCIPAWSALCEEENKKGDGLSDSSLRKRWTAAISIFTAALALTIIYVCIYPNPLIHQAAYACVTFYVVGCSVRLARKYVRDPRENGNLSKCMGMGAAMFSLAYVLWLLDVHACSLWRRLRRDFLLLPLGTLLELHAWWHLLTGMGVYYFIMALIYLRQLLHDRREEYMIIWRWRVLPEVTHRDKKLWRNYSVEFLGPYVKDPAKGEENSHLKSN